VHDRSSPERPARHPDGVEHVLVNGVPVVERGRPTGRRPGSVVRAA
jgi:hypothetical protein